VATAKFRMSPEVFDAAVGMLLVACQNLCGIVIECPYCHSRASCTLACPHPGQLRCVWRKGHLLVPLPKSRIPLGGL
jgi:hypothetical protein